MTDRHVDRDPYDLLGVPRDATDEEIAKAYRRLARRHHPDANPDATGGNFTGITDAYDLLRDPERRRTFDDVHRSRAGSGSEGSMTRIPVRHGDGGGSRGRHASSADEGVGAPVVAVPFEVAALGATVSVPIRTATRCTACDGVGEVFSTCSRCGGAGSVTRDTGGITIRSRCRHCDGHGHTRANRCPSCQGTGSASEEREHTVRIPRGTRDGARLWIADASRSGLDRGVAVTVHVEPHPSFSRSGDDLEITVPITIAEAALGATIPVPTLEGRVRIRIPPGTSPGRRLRVRGHGVPHGEGRGDLLVTVEVVIPDHLTDAQRQALVAFDAATPSPRPASVFGEQGTRRQN